MAEKKGTRVGKAASKREEGKADFLKELIEIDIYRGINELKQLKELKEPKTQKAKKIKKDLEKDAYRHSGIEFVYNKIISKFLEGIINDKKDVNILVEYSLLPSTLDPMNPNQLKCCSFLVDNNDNNEFKNKVEKEYTKCIDETAEDEGISIYQHPDFLYNIPVTTEGSDTMPAPKKPKCHLIYQDIGVTVTRRKSRKDPSKSSKSLPEQDANEQVGHYVSAPGNDKKLFMESFSLDRVFQELISGAKEASKKKDLSIFVLQSHLHNLCHERISKSENTKTSYYISFSVLSSRASNQLPRYIVEGVHKDGEENVIPLQSIGACFVYLEFSKWSKDMDEKVKEATKTLCINMGNFLRFISSNYVFNLGLRLQENARKEALKSAKAAIMSRNMSHNLGSHVMSYLKQHLSSVNNMLNNHVLAEMYSRHKLSETVQSEIEKEQVAMPFLTGLGQFISYLQERQDFIATIATDFIPYNSNVNFKDHIYDELNPDKRFERHRTERPNSKRIDNLLLGYIAKSEGLGRRGSQSSSAEKDNTTEENELSDIVLKFKNFDGNPAAGRQKKDLELMRDLDVALPGGVVGRQALFSIIENVIRNAAKHGHWKDSKKLELTFDYYTNKTRRDAPNDDNYDDNHKSLRSVLDDLYTPAVDSDDLYFFTLTDNSTTTEDVLVKLRKAIAEDYVKSNGELMDGNKGIKEMRISAAWLRAISSDYEPSIEGFSKEELKYDKNWELDENSHAPILYARLSKDDNGKAHLQYIFCLMIPKKIAIISPGFNGIISKIENYCGLFSSVEAFLEQSDTSYEFIIFDDRSQSYHQKRVKYINDRYQLLRRNSSSRLMKLSSLSNADLIKLIEETIANGKIRKRVADEAVLLLLKQLANNDRNRGQNTKDYILIQDKAPVIDKGMNAMVGRNCPEGDYSYYMYRSHHETAEQFKGFFDTSGQLSSKVDFVEGITGDNSTDRLIRRMDIDEEWYYRHLHAMKSNVAVIDERLFSSVFGLEEADLKNQPVAKSSRSSTNSTLQKMKAKSVATNEMSPKVRLKSTCEAKGFKPTVLKQKGVYVFNLVQNEERPKEFVLYGIKIDSFSDISEKLNSEKGGYRSACTQLLTLSWNGKKLDINPLDEWKKNFNSVRYNYLSIHQGLLDKLYGAFGIDKEDAEKKEILTRDLYKFFFSKRKLNIITYANKKKFFLPGMCIHSGRSKPDRHDMPQHLPFIQYAAIEHAVNDSKYSLVELLDFARYQDE